MAIKILEDRIEFDNFSLVTSARGLSVVEKGSTATLAALESSSILSSTYSFQGKEYGYVSGGHTFNPTAPTLNFSRQIQKFPLVVAGGLMSLVGNLTKPVGWGVTGHNSSTDGYTSGGSIDVIPAPIVKGINPIVISTPPSVYNDYAENIARKNKTSFASDNTVQQGGTYLDYFRLAAGVSSQTNGYTVGGFAHYYRLPGGPIYNQVDYAFRKFSFSSDVNASSTPNAGNGVTVGFSGSDKGVCVGDAGGISFPFASDIVSTTFLSPGTAHRTSFSINSSTNGYFQQLTPLMSLYRKIPFSNVNVNTQVGNLHASNRNASTGISSINHGIITGGTGYDEIGNFVGHPQSWQSTLPVSYPLAPPATHPVPVAPTTPLPKSSIERFPFATDLNTVLVGNLSPTYERFGAAGFQY
jgi:hypothetical protein